MNLLHIGFWAIEYFDVQTMSMTTITLEHVTIPPE